MSGEEKHKQNLEIYLNNGGSEKLAKSLKLPTLENRAKILYLIKDFQKNLESLEAQMEKYIQFKEVSGWSMFKKWIKAF